MKADPVDDHAASGSGHVTSYVVSVPDGFLLHDIGTGAVQDLAYSDDGALLAFGTWSSGIRIADAVTGAVIRTIPNPHDGFVHRVLTPGRTRQTARRRGARAVSISHVLFRDRR